MLKVADHDGIITVTFDGVPIDGVEAVQHDSLVSVSYEVWGSTASGVDMLANLPLSLFSVSADILSIRLSRDDGLTAPPWLNSVWAIRPSESAHFRVTGLFEFTSSTPGLLENAGVFATQLGHLPDLKIYDLSLSTAGNVDFRAELVPPVNTLREAVQHLASDLMPALATLNQSSSQVPTLRLSFDFPSHVRAACEQYLLHFAEFLRDLGSDATIELREVASQVLFAVTPCDREQALERVQTALEIFLALPSADLVDGTVHHADQIVAFKLRAALAHLRAQLELADAQKAALREQIRAQDIIIDLLKYRTFVPASRIAPEGISPSADKAEAIAPYVSVTAVEHAGVRIDLPRMLRDLKRLFRPK